MMEMKEDGNRCVNRNSEILFLYDAKLCNPNGDPDDENKPRFDVRTQINLVSDVRLKRFFRDYIIQEFGEKYIYVGTVEGKKMESDKRGWSLLEQWDGDERVKGIKKEETDKWAKLIPRLCIDARLFGAAVAVRKREKAKGASINFTGPVQFAWGYSLHPVEMVDSTSITSVFKGRESKEEEEGAVEGYGTIGKDWRLYYSLIGFYGVVSGLRAQKMGVRDIDLKLMDNFLWDSFLLMTKTRSKITEWPCLYLRVEYKDSNILIGDFREYVECEYTEPIRSFEDLNLNFDALIDRLNKSIGNIEAIYLRISEKMEKRYGLGNKFQVFGDKLKILPHPDVELQRKELIEKILASA